MRIGAYNQIAQVYGSKPAKKSYGSDMSHATSIVDQVSFSSVGKDMQIAKNILSEVPDIREDKVMELKKRIADGTYQVSAESFAEKLLSAYDEKSI